MEQDVLIIGTGGHARVVSEILRSGNRKVVGYAVPPGQPVPAGTFDAPVLKWEDAVAARDRFHAIVGIGDNLVRQEVFKAAEEAGFSFTTAVHPAAVVGSGVQIGAGTVVAAGAVLVLNVLVGRGVIINTGASVDHDSRLGDWVHLAPGAVVAGSVVLGNGVFIGAGGVVINGISIGRQTTIGAGGVVVHDLPEKVVAVGVPARILHNGDE